MKTRRLGKTDVALSEIGFGCGAIGNLYRPVSTADANDVMQCAWDNGFRYFDTAPFYGHGLSERRVGDFLRDKPEQSYVLSTKVGKLLDPCPSDAVPDHGFVNPLPFDVRFDYSGDAIRRSHEFSLARLGLNRTDILWVHDLEPKSLGSAYQSHLANFLDTGIAALEDLKRQGVIRGFGLGVNEVQPCLDVLSRVDLDGILLAGRYTLLDRSAERDLIPLCAKRSTSLVIGGVFNSGILATGAVEGALYDYRPAPDNILKQVAQMEQSAKAAGVTLAQAAMAFPLRNPVVASVLIGTAKRSSLQRNIDAMTHPVSEAFWAQDSSHTTAR
ncbi:pyridoxal 4-dehydrogenase [Pseudoruegeria sp. SK021]|nr:pyridoxal 4-dehydrogenase [Pseudoruegeria sp. SK021]